MIKVILSVCAIMALGYIVMEHNKSTQVNEEVVAVEKVNVTKQAETKAQESYAAKVTSVMELARTREQAMHVLKAAEESKVSYKVLAALIYSESEFKPCHHANKDWVGLAGINAPVWKEECPYDPYTERGNIYAAAWILSYYLKESKGNYLEALTHYKGYSPMGRTYAQRVLAIRYKNF